jgi:hypothetical protein
MGIPGYRAFKQINVSIRYPVQVCGRRNPYWHRRFRGNEFRDHSQHQLDYPGVQSMTEHVSNPVAPLGTRTEGVKELGHSEDPLIVKVFPFSNQPEVYT